MPETWGQAAVTLTLVVPGFVYRASWQSVAGPDPARPDFGTRVLHAMVATGVFAGAYAAAFVPVLAAYAREPAQALGNARAVGLGFVVLAIALPWLAARLCFWVVRSDRFVLLTARTPPALRRGRPLDHPPSAWDRAFGGAPRGWVRVRFADGRWLGGWYGDDSFATTHPHPPELFVEEGWVVGDDGTFSDVVHAPGGMVIRCADAVAVDFLPCRREDRTGGRDDDVRTVQPRG
ncbi:MAG: DUF6338 family protein [Cellulomonas sp.]